MINISKEDAHALHDNYGIRFGENGISRSRSEHPRYYLCEDAKCMNAFNKLNSTKKRTVFAAK